ncbi:exodeoxyribonuclease III [Orrella marina]|uniref:Exodeoxyribonuclease III n=1 Tax=Orrella marina TaxID=2163011 RepID=A0A2R4XGF6_9BURK|nr:exodeoxyribonuclease III [Orrella marina]AWB32910.1 exodeoxyribonuclease III [Orrella marina]
MKIATWNVNSLKVRLPQVLDWLATQKVDFLCLQELKLDQDRFPLAQIEAAGYKAVWAGQKTYNGVAILSLGEGGDVVRNIPGFEDPQQRVITATYGVGSTAVRVINAYCPNGQSLESDKYQYKLAWYDAFADWLKTEMERHPNVVVLGDYNIAPTDDDVHNPERWKGQVLVSEPERAALTRLIDLGLTDSFRLFDQPPKSFSWWDYRLNGYKRNAGLRIDHILLSEPLAKACRSCVIDKVPRENPQPSDHAPVVAEIAIG